MQLTAGLVLAGLMLTAVLVGTGLAVAGLGLVGMAGWLLMYDVARRTLRRGRLARFGSVSLLLGYGWLGATRLLRVLGQERVPGGLAYDAMLHSLFLRFGFSMIFGQAPTIIPAVTGVAVPFQHPFYGHLALLHASLLVRIGADLAVWQGGRRWGGVLNAVAIELFVVLTSAAARRANRPVAAHMASVRRRRGAWCA